MNQPHWLDIKPFLCPPDNSSSAAQTTRESGDRQVFQKALLAREGCERLSYPAGQKLPAGLHHTPFIFPEGLSSIETLLTNIQVSLCCGFVIMAPLRWIGREMSHSLGFPEIVNSRRERHLGYAVIGFGRVLTCFSDCTCLCYRGVTMNRKPFFCLVFSVGVCVCVWGCVGV